MKNTSHKSMPLWVFGYGSLIWRPGFRPIRQEIASIKGYRRSFCMWSWHYRGTIESPGLVLALDAQAESECAGVAFEVCAKEAQAVLKALRARELISDAYRECFLPVSLASGGEVEAVCYVIDKAHEQYCAGLSLEKQAEIIHRAHGAQGQNREYLYQTVSHLNALGIKDESLCELENHVKALEREKKVDETPIVG